MTKLDPVLLLLTGLIVFFAIILVGLAKFLSDDGQTFQVVGNVLSGFVGALLMRVKTDTGIADPGPGGSSQILTKEIKVGPLTSDKA